MSVNLVSSGVAPQALLKKHEALMSDLSAYGSSISSLKEQATSCRVSLELVTHTHTHTHTHKLTYHLCLSGLPQARRGE